MNFDKTSNRAVMKGERFFFAFSFIYIYLFLFFIFSCNLLILDKAERLRANKCGGAKKAKTQRCKFNLSKCV